MMLVQAAKPAKYGQPTASRDSFRRALRSALVFKVAYGIMQHFFAYHASTADAEARGHLQDLLTHARNTHHDWKALDQEIAGWKVEIESNPLVWAQAVHDIAGNYQEFRQDVLQREVQEQLQRPDLKDRVRQVLLLCGFLERTG